MSKGWGDWRDSPSLLWRLSTKHGSAGDLGDIGVHIYDLTSFLFGDISTIYCQLKTFDKGVAGNRVGEYVFDANDNFASTVTFANGALGTIHSSRWAVGQANSLRARVYGTRARIEIDLDRSYDEYKVCTGEDNIKAFKWETVKARPRRPTTSASSTAFAPGSRTRPTLPTV